MVSMNEMAEFERFTFTDSALAGPRDHYVIDAPFTSARVLLASEIARCSGLTRATLSSNKTAMDRILGQDHIFQVISRSKPGISNGSSHSYHQHL